jgi:hypothetical protein
VKLKSGGLTCTEVTGVPTKLQAEVTLLLGLVGLQEELHCDSLELLSLKVMLQGNLIKMSFTGSRNHTVCSPLKTGSLAVPVAALCEA